MPLRIRQAFICTLICSAFLLGSCGSEEDRVLNGDSPEEEDLNTWIWALDDNTGTIRVYDADTGTLAVTLVGQSHPMMRQVFAGPDAEPTVWMGTDGSCYGFTRGFYPHGDHAHMEIPEAVAQLATGPTNTHQGVDEHGDYLVYANDGDATFTLIDVATRTSATIHHGSGHSAALYSHGHLVATDMHNRWVRIIDAARDSIRFQVEIDTLAHGDAFHHDSETLFIATLGGFEVLELDEERLAAKIPYPTAGRVNFLYHAGEVPVAFGPHQTEGTSDKIILLHLENRTSEAITISGATLGWNISAGNFALSENGKMVVAADVAKENTYLICIDADNASCYRSVATVTVPAADMACAINYAGDHIWVLNKTTGLVSCYHPEEGELHNSWQADAASDYIFATSLAPGVEVVKDFSSTGREGR